MSAVLVPENSLITATAEEGRALALQMARLNLRALQPERTNKSRPWEFEDAKDAAQLIQLAQLVTAEFTVIAAANQYWRA